MPDFIASALERAPTANPAWLDDLQAAGRQTWAASAMPTRKTEAWKYTSLARLERGAYLRPPAPATPTPANLKQHFSIEGLDAATLVFVNGSFNPDLSSDALPDGIEMVRFAEASESQAEAIRAKLGQLVDGRQHLFAALNDAWLADGLFLRVRRNTRVDTPVHCVFLTTAQDQPFSLSARLLVVLEDSSEATIIEHFCSDDLPQNAFTNSVTELVLGANAKLQHYRLQREQEQAVHIGGVHASLGRDSTLNSFHLGMGSTLKRVDVVVNHHGEGAHCDLSGVYLPRHQQHVDYHTCIEHAVPRCTTTETFRGIIADEARAVFNGRIHIHPNAQKTVAELSNRNLLTSTRAQVDTKPELEIYADDVQCAHGATVARLDEQAMNYLQSRGIGTRQAEVMLSFGFINELVERLPDEAMVEFLRPQLASLFGRQSLVTGRPE
jgi:Fe-S cluster assembly protein SufD